MHITEYIALVSLGFCALLGLGSLISPAWAARTVRLVADPDPSKPGGYSEFRATYGGLLFMLHMMAIVIVLYTGPYISIFTLLPIAAAWLGAGIGRSVSLVLDTKQNRQPGMIPIWICTEFALALAIASPLLQLV